MRLGELLRELEKAKGAAAGGHKQGSRGSYTEPRDTRPTLAQLGIDKKTSMVAHGQLMEVPSVDSVRAAGVVFGTSAARKRDRRP